MEKIEKDFMGLQKITLGYTIMNKLLETSEDFKGLKK